jgi:hypothetical protein
MDISSLAFGQLVPYYLGCGLAPLGAPDVVLASTEMGACHARHARTASLIVSQCNECEVCPLPTRIGPKFLIIIVDL